MTREQILKTINTRIEHLILYRDILEHDNNMCFVLTFVIGCLQDKVRFYEEYKKSKEYIINDLKVEARITRDGMKDYEEGTQDYKCFDSCAYAFELLVEYCQ